MTNYLPGKIFFKFKKSTFFKTEFTVKKREHEFLEIWRGCKAELERGDLQQKKKSCFETRRNNYGNSFSLQSLQIFLSVKTL